MKIIRLETTDSTNNWIAQNEHNLPSTAMVWCDNQTAGRGQRGNRWESAPGMNITASLIFHPLEFPAQRQFSISESIALAVKEFLETYGVRAKIKWPNDIYVGEGKICGILVEHVVTGMNLSRTIAGVGININQTEFFSDAPNPVSLSMLTGKVYNLEVAVKTLGEIFEKYLSILSEGKSLHREFMESIWRGDEAYYMFRDCKQKEHLEAKIHDITEEGLLILEGRAGERKSYSFKEVEFIL